MSRLPLTLAIVSFLVTGHGSFAEPPMPPTPNAADDARAQAETAISKRLLDQAIAMAEGTVKQYQALGEAHATLGQRLAGLMTNDEGKRLAATLDPVLSREMSQNLDSPVLDVVVLQANQKQAAALVEQLRRERENLAPGYVPPEGIITESHSLSNWANEALANVKTRNAWLDDQLSVVPKDFDVKTAPALDVVIADFRRREHEAWAAARKHGIEEATPQGQAAISEAARTAELEKMLQESRAILERTRSDLTQQKSEHDAAIARQRDAYEQQAADLRRQLAESKAKRDVQEAETDAVAKKGEIDADKVKLRQEAQDPAIQKLLAPLLAKGHSQPGSEERQLEATPVSLSKLRTCGALDRSEKGLMQFARAGMKRFGTSAALKLNPLYDRPEWGYPVSWSKWSQEQRDELLRAQDAINRLGPTMVEMGFLAE